MVRLLTALLLGVALVLMHHVVGTPHGTVDAPAITVEAHAPAVHDHGTGDHSTGVPAEAPHGDHASMLLHLCLAVLVALATALLLPNGRDRGRRPDDADDDPGGSLVVTAVPRPPPTPIRLARLQVLRL